MGGNGIDEVAVGAVVEGAVGVGIAYPKQR